MLQWWSGGLAAVIGISMESIGGGFVDIVMVVCGTIYCCCPSASLSLPLWPEEEVLDALVWCELNIRSAH